MTNEAGRPAFEEYFADNSRVSLYLWKCAPARELLAQLYLHHPPTALHSLRVGDISGQLAQRGGFDTEDIEAVTHAGLLHDIGKLSISSTILGGGELGEAERKIIRQHARVSFDVVRKFDEKAAQILVAHHEFQVLPYPRENRRIERQDLLQLQFLIAIADSVDALLEARSYKDAWTSERVILTLRDNFDPEVVQQAVEIATAKK